jgi:hypothetical protein
MIRANGNTWPPSYSVWRLSAHHRNVVFAGKRQAAGDHLVEHDAERPDIGPHITALADEMLRRHVGDGPDRRAGARQRRAASQLGDAEVEELHLARDGLMSR